MLSGDLGAAAASARRGGLVALEAIGLTTMQPVQPMLAGTSSSVTDAVAELGLASVEWKLDGARVQIHRSGDDVAIFTRNLNEITDRLPGVAAMVRDLPVRDAVFDGEVLGVDADGRPDRFQDTMSRFGGEAAQPTLRAFLFDVLHADGTDLLDEPLHERLAVLETLAAPHRVPHLVTADAAEAERFAEGALAAGHEGVMVKAIESPYEAGRRGTRWRKVKPVRTLDLVVLAAEWGHGRRQGWLSNLHLGARGADGTFVMVGKTFKGLTDQLLEWQTAELLAREIGRDGIVVHVRPELVAEIALDGVQVSRRYPGGVALRFARVKRYRPDKAPSEADTIEAVQAMLATAGPGPGS
jgi:DNA ligase-1